MAIRIGLVGLGKIAQDQHVPALTASGAFDLVAAATLAGELAGGPTYRSVEAMLAAETLDAVALCQPPQARFNAGRAAIDAGCHVFLEKPPGATLSEVAILADLAAARGVTLFASWHSRYAPGVEPARAWLAARTVRHVSIVWKEDVRHWHPGQAWIWQAGGLGVFDPGINALSIATHILPPFFLTRGTLEMPANRAAPIAATLKFATAAGAPVDAVFDWRQTGTQTWDIRVETDDGALLLERGGDRLTLAGVAQPLPAEGEYPALYARFAELIAAGRSDVDLAPLRHVADAFLASDRVGTEAFHD